MLPLDTAVSLTTATLALLTLAGLLVRHKARACVLFPVYLGTAAGGHLLIAGWPGNFWNWQFLAATDAVQAALRLGVAFELAHKTFKLMPRGYARVGLLMALVALGIVLAAALVPRHFGDAYDLFRALQPVSYWTGGLFFVYLGAVLYYGIPVDPLHRAIATGFGIVTVAVGCAGLLWRFDPAFGLGRDVVVKTAYPLILCWWTVSAWRRDAFAELSSGTVRRLYPWRTP